MKGTVPFERRKHLFRSGLEMKRIPWVSGSDRITIDRTDLFNSSMNAIKKCNLYKVLHWLFSETLIISFQRK